MRPADLANYKIGSLRGVVFSDQLTEGMQRIHSDSVLQLLNMLIHNRVDVIVTNEIETIVEIAKHFPNDGIVGHTPALIELPIYHYIHKSRAPLATKIETALKEIVANGQARKIRSDFLHAHGVPD